MTRLTAEREAEIKKQLSLVGGCGRCSFTHELLAELAAVRAEKDEIKKEPTPFGGCERCNFTYVLLAKLEKERNILAEEVERLREKLTIAVSALEQISEEREDVGTWVATPTEGSSIAKKALAQIRDMGKLG